MSPSGSRSSNANRLRTRLFLFFALGIFCFGLFLFLATYQTLIAHLQKAQTDAILHAVEMRAAAVGQWCRRAKDVARQVTSRSRMRQELEKYNRGEVGLASLRSFTTPKLEDAMDLSEEMVGIVRTDRQNRVVAACGIGAEHPDLAGLIHTLLPISEVTLIPPLSHEGKSVLLAVAPIRDGAGAYQGADLVLFEPTLLDPLTCIYGVQDPGSEDGLAYPTESDFRPVCPKVECHVNLFSNPQAQRFFQYAQAGSTGVESTDDSVFSFAPVEHSDWVLISRIDAPVAFAPIKSRITQLLALFFAIYLGILGGFWLLLNPLAGRILLQVGELEQQVTERTREKEKVIRELQEALGNIKTLQGLLPVCSYCKKIRDDKGYWDQMETYISKHSEALFSHSICPTCFEQQYPDEHARFKAEGKI